MPEPLHHSTLAAITRLAQARGLPIVRADSEMVIVGDYCLKRSIFDGRWYCNGGGPLTRRPLYALRAALRESDNYA